MASPSRIPSLVSTKWLFNKLKTKNLSILDASWHLPTSERCAKTEFDEKHIPGAKFFNIDECSDRNTTLSHMLPTPKEFERYVSDLGVSNSHYVVIYDNHDKFAFFSAPRAWWMFRVFGHNQVSVLDGGFKKWCTDNLEIETKTPVPVTSTFKANFHPHLVKSFEQIKDNVMSQKFLLLDARSADRFHGQSTEPRQGVKSGHIRNSINMPFSFITDPSTGLAKSPELIRAWFKNHGVNLKQDLASTCGSGVTACSIALAAHLCGQRDVAVYDGSWMEWFERADDSLKEDVPN